MQHYTVPVHCLKAILRPVVRLFIRNTQSYQTFCTIAKAIFVEVAEKELRSFTTKVNTSRISALTGLNRNEVTRLVNVTPEQGAPPISLTQRIIGRWQTDPRFITSNGTPRVLSYEGTESEFHNLVRAVNQHLNPGTVLFSLESRGFLQRSPRGVRLQEQVDYGAGNVEEVSDLLAHDVATLFDTVHDNLGIAPSTHLHLRTEFDNIQSDKLSEIRAWLLAEGRALHKRAREYLAQYDLDVNGVTNSEAQGGGKVVLGSFSFSAEKPVYHINQELKKDQFAA